MVLEGAMMLNNLHAGWTKTRDLVPQNFQFHFSSREFVFSIGMFAAHALCEVAHNVDDLYHANST